MWSGVAADWKQRFEVGDAIIDPAGDWDPTTAQAYIDAQISTVTSDLAAEIVARQSADTGIQSQVNTIKKNKIYLAGTTLTQSMINTPQTIYVIKDDLTLTENINIPSGCVLEFEGGSVRAGNGSDMNIITGQNTGIEAGLVKIFDIDITLSGTWDVGEANSEWFDNNEDKSLSINKCLKEFKVCKLGNKIYNINSPIYINSDYCSLVGCGTDTVINVSNNFDIIDDSDNTKTRIDGRVDFYNAAIMARPGNYGDANIVTTDLIHWCNISNLRIEGNDIVPTGIEMWGLTCNISNIIIRRTNKEALLLRRGWNNKFSNINCNYNNGNGVVFESECNSNLLERVEVDHYGDIGILINQGCNISLVNCDVESGNINGIKFSPKKFTELKTKNNNVMDTSICGVDILGAYFENIGKNSSESDSSAICITGGSDIINGSINISGVFFNDINRCFYIDGGIVGGIIIYPYRSLLSINSSYIGYINGQRMGNDSNITIYDVESHWSFLNDYESKQVCFIYNNETGTKTFNGLSLTEKTCVLKQAGDIDRKDGNLRYYLGNENYIFLNTVRRFLKTISGVTFKCYHSSGMITIIATGTATEAISTDISFSDCPFRIANDLGTESFVSQAGDGTGTIQTRDYNVLYADIASGQIVNKRITFPAAVS